MHASKIIHSTCDSVIISYNVLTVSKVCYAAAIEDRVNNQSWVITFKKQLFSYVCITWKSNSLYDYILLYLKK